MRLGRTRRTAAAVIGVAVLAAACDGGGGSADDENPLDGEDVTLVVGTSPGGGYDAYARAIAPELAERLGATVVVSNEPGAGGLVALNNLLASPADGTTIMLINGPGIGGSALVGAEGANFALDELAYIGRVSDAPRMVASGIDSGFESVEDLEGGEPFVIGATGPGASTYVEPLLLFEIMGWPYDLITGYEGSSEAIAGMIAGEVDGVMLDIDTVGTTVRTDDAYPLFMMAVEEPVEGFEDVPNLGEADLDDETRELADAAEALALMGRTLVVNPETDDALIDYLEGVIADILTDEEFMEASAEQGRPVGYADPDQVGELVQTLLDAPPRFQEILESGY